MQNFQYLIIGGGIAGGKAIDGIRSVDQKGSLALLTSEGFIPYQRPPLSKHYLRGESHLDRVTLEDEAYYDQKNAQILTERVVTKIDPRQHLVYTADGETFGYQRLLLATGGYALRLDIPGSDLGNVFTLRTVEDSRTIRKAAEKSKTALVMGASFIGSEISASLTQMGVNVIQIFPEARLMERLMPKNLSMSMQDKFKSQGVRILPGTVAHSLLGETNVRQAKLSTGETLDIDMVVMGVGIGLNTALAKDAGLKIRPDDQAVMVDEHLRTSHEHIYAAGDIAAWPDPTFGRRMRVEHWDVARRQGKLAGKNMAGKNEPYTALPYFFTDLFDWSCEVWGDLEEWDETIVRGEIDQDSFTIFYFQNGRLNGVLGVDVADEERKPLITLLKERPGKDQLASKLQNQAIALTELISS